MTAIYLASLGEKSLCYRALFFLFLHRYPVMGWSINRQGQLCALLTRKQSGLEGPEA